MENDELFLIDPDLHLALARKIAMQVGKFQGWEQIEVIGRRCELLGQQIEEIHRIGSARLEGYKTKDGIALRLANPSFVMQAWVWMEAFKRANARNVCGK